MGITREKSPGEQEEQGKETRVAELSKEEGTIVCPTICSPMNCSTPGLPVHRQLPAAAKLLQSCLTLCDPIDGRPPMFLGMF